VADRTYDLQLFPIAGIEGGVVTGLLKIAQRWAVLFATELGSKKFQPERGCDFPRQLRNGELGSEAAVRSAFSISSQQVFDQLVQGESPDEQLEGVTLTGVSSTGNNLSLTVRFLTLAGESREAMLPIRYTQVVTI